MLLMATASGIAAPGEEVLFADSFPGLDLRPDWVVVDASSAQYAPSEWRAENGRLHQSSDIYRTDNEYDYYEGTHIVAGSPQWTNYKLVFDLMSKDDDGVGAIVCYQDSGNYYRFIMVQDQENNGPFRRLEKFVDGRRIVLAETGQGYTVDQTYHMEVVSRGGQLEVWLDGEKILAGHDKTFTAGKIGFLTYANEGLYISNVKVVKL